MRIWSRKSVSWERRSAGSLPRVTAGRERIDAAPEATLRAPDTDSAQVQQMKTADDSKTFISIPLKGDDDDTILKNYQAIEPDLKKVNDGDIQLAGLNPLASELTGTIGEDQKRAEVAAILVEPAVAAAGALVRVEYFDDRIDAQLTDWDIG